MAADGARLSVEIVAPDRRLWSGVASFVSAPAAEGDVGLLPNHESVLALLRPGTIRVHDGSGVTEFAVTEGFLSFDDNAVTVVVGGRG